MSNDFIFRLDTILDKESGLKIVGVTKTLQETVMKFLKIREVVNAIPKRIGICKSLQAPAEFKSFKENLATYQVSPSQIAEMEHSFLRLQFEAEGIVKGTIEGEKKKIVDLKEFCDQLSVDISKEVKEAEDCLEEMISLSTNGSQEEVGQCWVNYMKCLTAIQDKPASAVPKGIINTVNRLIKGEKVKLNDVNIEDLKAIKDTPICKQITLSLGKGP